MPQAIKEALEGLEARLVALEEELQREGQRLPNMTHPGACTSSAWLRVEMGRAGWSHACFLAPTFCCCCTPPAAGCNAAAAPCPLLRTSCIAHGAPTPGSQPLADVAVGGEDVSVQLVLVGQRRQFDFPTKDHLQLGEELDLIDFETGGVVRRGAAQPLA